MTDTKADEAGISLTLLENKENVAAQPPPSYGTVSSHASQATASPKSPSETIVVSVPQLFDHSPTECICWNCHERVVTRVEKSTGFLPWIFCVAILMTCCVFGCCLIPFCIKDLKDTEHYCPNCGTQLGRKRRL